MRVTRISSRRLISATVIAGVTGLAPALIAPASLAKGGSIAARPSCVTSGLVVWLNTAGNGAAGSIYYNLYFTNLSAHTCNLRGFPGVSAVDLFGRRVGRAASRESVQKPTVVTLQREATAAAVLRIVDAANFTASACHEATAAGLRVYPPGQARSKLIPFPFKVCSRTAVNVLSVRALVPKA
ncbi:MAG TPA: DUF4232 domain-containing protein [Solirubrobacteraceae bacterium]|nr:DUF4232 domain-containing protein [Solirubrobacteraceae bacterium]